MHGLDKSLEPGHCWKLHSQKEAEKNGRRLAAGSGALEEAVHLSASQPGTESACHRLPERIREILTLQWNIKIP